MRAGKLASVLLAAALLPACAGTAPSGASRISGDIPVTASAPASSAASQAPAYRFALTPPEGFLVPDSGSTEGYLAFYEASDGSTISLQQGNKDPDFAGLDAQAFAGALQAQYAQAMNDAALVVTVSGLDQELVVSGCQAYRMDLSVQGTGYQFTQTFLGIDADVTYTFVFTDASGSHQEAFDAAIASVRNVEA